MEHWFTVERLEADTFAISEYRHWEETHCYLLLGKQQALLIDTGLGVGDLGREVKKLTGLQILTAATHVHWDHIGGHRQFDRHCVHSAERSWLAGDFPLPLAVVKSQLTRDCRLPVEFDPESYTIYSGEPWRLLEDGDTIDLGGRTITALHTPGHSPGHLCFWEEARGSLYSGDLVYQGTLYANYPSTDPEAYLWSLEKTASLPVKGIFPGHHSLNVPLDLPRQMRDALRKLKAAGMLRHGSGLQQYDGWSLLL